MNTINTTATELFRSMIGREVETLKGIMNVNDVLTFKTGVMKDSSKAPYIHLASETGEEMDLHPQKAYELFTKGECGKMRILAAIAGEEDKLPKAAPVEDYSVAAETNTELLPAFSPIVETTAAALIDDLTVPAVVVAATALGMTIKQVVEGAIAAGDAGAAVAESEKKESKKEATIRIYTEGHAAGLARKDIIARMRTELNMGVPGANTYYQNVKSGMWK